MWPFAGLAIGIACFAYAFAGQTQASPPATPAQITFFENDIRPIFANSCYQCHGATNPAAGLNLTTLQTILKGGKSGPAIVPGDPDNSLLIKAVRQTGSLKMPMGGKLTQEQVENLTAWVKMGAPWPQAQTGAQTARFWSLEPVKMPAIPKVKEQSWVRNDIDAFVLAALEAKHLKPGPEADKRTLLRRVTYDLTGLPPTPQEMDAFLADKSKNAYEKVVDRLLASPHYGERCARQWMDVARYADDKGYVFNEDRNYYNAYTYREWLIEAFNQDLPYDQFVIDQLAADQLPGIQEDPKPLAAMGFLTLGRRFLNSQPDIIDDRIDVTMRGFEGLTVECARCHDHKFDPIPTQDYYSLYAVFASSTEKEIPISGQEVDEPWQKYEAQISQLTQTENQVSLDQANILRKKLNDPGAASSITDAQKATLQSINITAPPTGEDLNKLLPAYEPAAQAHLKTIFAQLKDLVDHPPAKPELAMAMVDDAHPNDGRIFLHGNPNAAGEVAPRRFLAALTPSGEERVHWTKDSGRLELAEDIASKTNPLTARVFVNRLWQDHFGMGIVATASDFGHQGERPSDQPLLDYLASDFMDHGWKVKRMQKEIVMSAAYRQSATASPQTFATDPENRLFGHANRRRLDLEEMRDSFLQAAGKLDLADMGGKSVDLWSEPFTPRRAVYGFIERQNLPGIFRTFDYATPDATSAKRFETTVPQQALFFMNSPFAVQAAQELTNRPEVKGAKTTQAKIRALYRLLFQRDPTAQEMSIGSLYLKPGTDTTVESPDAAWSYGYGSVTSFTPFAYYADGAYRIGKTFPDPKLGYAMLNGVGGHPGRDQDHAVIRRWTAPYDMTVQISGVLAHRQAQGDGVRGRVALRGAHEKGPAISEGGNSLAEGWSAWASPPRSLGFARDDMRVLGEWTVHNSSSPTDLTSVQVKKGDTIDFMVDCLSNDAYDSFSWAPVISSTDGAGSWDASVVTAPPGPGLTRLTLYAQALLMTNEFMFID